MLNRIFDFLKYWLILVMILSSTSVICQEDNISQSMDGENAQREEIQRYFGYEDLLFRYLTIPYDTSMNVNQQGKYVDIGFAIFALVPIAILLMVYQHKRWFYGLMALFILYLLMCLHFSFLLNDNMSKYNPVTDVGHVSRVESQPILDEVYRFSGITMTPVINMMRSCTGIKDRITYPIVCSLFLLIVWLVIRNPLTSIRFRVMALMSIVYIMLWWILSGAIPWYGYLLLPLGYMFILSRVRLSLDYIIDPSHKFVKILTLFVISFWVFTAYASRVSNIPYLIEPPNQNTGVSIADHRIIPYAVGNINHKQAIDRLAANLSLAIDKMNEDEALILQCGSSVHFDIFNNHKRVFEDNNLSYFYGHANTFKTSFAIINFYKSVGIKYIILDLNIPTIDRTPEKSLTNKYRAMWTTLRGNPYIKLIATDQMINYKNVNNQLEPRMGVFPDPNVPQSKAFRLRGSYAVFEII